MMRPVKIVYIIGTLDFGGSERQLIRLVIGLDRSRFHPVVCCLSRRGPLADELAQHGVKVEIVSFRGLTILRDLPQVILRFRRLVLLFREEKPDILHGFLFWAYILGTYAAKLASVPIVLASRRGLGHFKADKPHYLFLERLANRLTDLIVANAEAVKQDVLRQELVEPSKVRVVYNGIDPSPYVLTADPALRASLGVPEAARVVGVVANLIPYKGHRDFLHACRAIRQRQAGITFLLIGDGPCRGALEGLARELGLEKDVRFLGTRRDIPQLLALMDVVVLPSLEEGFPNAILEAMAAGKPVVATRVGGVPEAVIHGETGLLIPPRDPQALADAILLLLADRPLADAMGRAGRDRVAKNFGLDRMIRETEALYEELLAAKAIARTQRTDVV